MSKRGALTGTPYHEEFHTVVKKKEKAADCIFLDKERICRNKASIKYCEKCFVASICKHRIKQHEVEALKAAPPPPPPAPKKAGKIVSIDCTLKEGCEIRHKVYGKGKFCEFNKEQRTISVEFKQGKKSFLYPDAFFEKHLRTYPAAYGHVCMDSKRAKREQF